MKRRIGGRLGLSSLFPVTLATVALAGSEKSAVTGARRHDRPDSLYRALASDPAFRPVGALRISGIHRGSVVVVAPHWVLTDAHVVSSREAGRTIVYSTDSLAVRLESTEFQVAEIVMHPEYWPASVPASADIFARRGFDVALLRLTTRSETPVARLVDADPSPGSMATYVGYGTSGTALSVVDTPEQGGTKRAGTNMIDQVGGRVGNRVAPPYLLIGDMDAPGMPDLNKTGSPEPTDLEYMPLGGDSGGGAFVKVNGEWRVAGLFVSSTIFDNDGDRSKGIYGSVIYITSAASLRSWIAATLSR